MVDTASVLLRFRDLDAFGHVYHAEYLTLLDELRTRWFGDALRLERPTEYVVARVELDYRSSLVLADRSVTCRFAVERVGTTSLTLHETMLTASGREVASSRTVVVLRDSLTGTSRRLSTEERERAENWLAPPA